MRVSLSSFEPDESVQEITNTLKREGGVILQNLAPPDLLDSVYEEIQENVPEAAQKRIPISGLTATGRSAPLPP